MYVCMHVCMHVCRYIYMQEAIDSIDEQPDLVVACEPPSNNEINKAIRKMSRNRSPGADGLPAEIFQHGGELLLFKLGDFIHLCWELEDVPQNFKDANIIHLYKKKGSQSDCNNHRGISLLSVAVKIMARVLLDRLVSNFSESIFPESQCGFRSGRGTFDMIFSARQLQEKCREQHMDLFMVFIDLVKAFDSVDRTGLWKLLLRLGCPVKIVNLIKAFHTGMMACVVEDGSKSEMFAVNNGVKQGCVLAPTLFSILFSVVLNDAFKNIREGVRVEFRTTGGVLNLRRLQAKTKVSKSLLRELLFADDCALVGHTYEDIQHIVNCLDRSTKRFGLSISLKKTEVLFQPRPGSNYNPPPVMIGDHPLSYVSNFKYLGSFLSNNATVDADVSHRISKASAAFGKLYNRLWQRHEIKLTTKVAVYKVVVLSVLLYGCESWTLLRRNLKSLESFHLRCLRRICGIQWTDYIPNTEVLSRCNISGIESFVMKCQFHWAGHMSRMLNDRIPKQLLFGQLEQGHRHQGGPKLRYKDSIKVNMKSCGIDFLHFEKLSSDRTNWRSLCHSSLQQFEDVLDIFKLNVRNGKNKLFLPTSHLFVNLVERNAVQKQVLNPTRDTEDTKESHHCYQWTCHHHHHVCIYACMYVCCTNF